MNRLRHVAPPVIVGVVFFALWEGLVKALEIREFLLPPPSSIWTALIEQWGGVEGGTLGTVALRVAGRNTAGIAISGLVIGVLAGAWLALIITRFRRFGESLTPFAIAINATPIIALAPIFNAWFGITDVRSNQAVVIAVVFFPVFINTAKGLSQAHPNQIELMRSYGASEFTILRRVQIPTALPFFVTSLKIAAPFSVIAAIVAEYFGGPQSRLGPVITQNASFARYDVAWAAIVVASGIGLGLFALALAAEYLLMPWRRRS